MLENAKIVMDIERSSLKQVCISG